MIRLYSWIYINLKKVNAFIFIYFLALVLNAQSYEWIDSTFQFSVFRMIYEVDGNIYGVVCNSKDNANNHSKIKIYKFEFEKSSSSSFSLVAENQINFDDNYSTLALKYIEVNKVWILVQSLKISNNTYNYRVLLCDRFFNKIIEKTVDSLSYPQSFHIDGNEENTYILGSIGPPSNKLFYLKYSHSQQFYLPDIKIDQSEPQATLFVTSMKIDRPTENMLLFSYNGISILDTNLFQIRYFNPTQVLTSDHGHLIGVGENYYSHGAWDSTWNVGLRKLVIHKYDSDFNILAADTFGRPGQDNYPFIDESIDARNTEILVGGHLDGPLSHFDFNRSIKKFYLAKYNEDLQQIWYKEFGGDKAYIILGLYLMDNGESLAYGMVTDTLTGCKYAYVLHTNSNGEIMNSAELSKTPDSSIKVMNPGYETFCINNSIGYDVVVRLFSINGCLILDGNIVPGYNNLSAECLPPGMYYYTIMHHGTILNSGEWLKIK